MNVRDGFFMLEGMRIALETMMVGLEVPKEVIGDTVSNIFNKWVTDHGVEEMSGTEEDMMDAYLDLLNATAK